MSIETKTLIDGPKDGKKPPRYSKVQVHYSGWLYDPKTGAKGAKFDSSVDRGQKFTFTLGAGEVIAGWDAVVKDMVPGQKVETILHPSVAYGSRGVGPIPPNSTLLFEIELFGWGEGGGDDGLFSIKNIIIFLICVGVVLFVKGNPFK